MRIAEVALYRVDLPLAEPFQHASSGHVTALQEVVAAVRSSDGVVGYGEVRGNCTYVTGDTPDSILAGARFLSPFVVGKSLDDLPALLERLEGAIVGNGAAKALLDMALHDAAARALRVPVTTLLGGRVYRRLPTDASVTFGPPGEAARQTEQAVREGYRLIKARVGLSLDEDEARLAAIRGAIDAHPSGKAVLLVVDANGAWRPKEALERLRRWERYRLGWLEQPVAPDDIEGLRFLREHATVPIMADESVHGPRDVLELVTTHAVDMLHFKIIKAGGLAPLKKMEAIAEAAGVPYMIGQMDEGMLATAAAVHAAAASHARFFEVHGYKRVASQPFRGIEAADGAMIVPSAPGFGVEVDESRLALVDVVRAGE